MTDMQIRYFQVGKVKFLYVKVSSLIFKRNPQLASVIFLSFIQ